MSRTMMKMYAILGAPLSVLFILNSSKIHPAYGMTLVKRVWLGWRMMWNNLRIRSGTSFKAHLAMALKILETPPEVEGDIVECGTWKGGSAANLSLVCRITNRKLRVYDSFQGLPEGDPRDRQASGYKKGDFCGTLEEVKRNIQRYGALESCEFIPGWFSDTLPQLSRPVLLAFLDVDLEASLDTCVKCIWPHLTSQGYIFTDECVGQDYTALFFSERWWRENFNQTPPGLIGAGTGLPLGEFYIGPYGEISDHRLQHASTGAYTRRDFSGFWDYYPTKEEHVRAVATGS
jgi:O-methyltransferase